jgi:hypothetical protein
MQYPVVSLLAAVLATTRTQYYNVATNSASQRGQKTMKKSEEIQKDKKIQYL